jgi:REP element-mobilizing transposase RayT
MADRSEGASAPLPEQRHSAGIVPAEHGRFNTRRMPGFDYLGQSAYHLIIVTAQRDPVLVNQLASFAAEALSTSASATRFDVLAYVVMPDHVHALVEGTSPESDLIRYVQRFKQAVGYRFKQEHARELWQWSYFDRVLRTEDDLPAVARYILGNPVQAGLTSPDVPWPFAGGTFLANGDGSE